MEETASSQLSVEKCLAIFVWSTLAVIQYFNFWNDDSGSYEEVDEIGPDGKRVTRKRLKPRAARKKAASYSRLRTGKPAEGEKADIEQPDDEDQDQDSSGYGSEEGRPHRKPARRRTDRDIGMKPKDKTQKKPELERTSSIRSQKPRGYGEEKPPKSSLSFDTGTQVTATQVDRGTTPHLPPRALGEEKEIKSITPAAVPLQPVTPQPSRGDEPAQKPVTAPDKSELNVPIGAKQDVGVGVKREVHEPKRTKSAEQLTPSAPKALEKIPEPPRKADAVPHVPAKPSVTEKPKDTKTAAIQAPAAALMPKRDVGQRPKTVRSADEVRKAPIVPRAPPAKVPVSAEKAAPKPKETKPVATQAFPPPAAAKPTPHEKAEIVEKVPVSAEKAAPKPKDTKPVATQAFPPPAGVKPTPHEKAEIVEPKVAKPAPKAPVAGKEAAPKSDFIQKPREVKSEVARKPPPGLPTLTRTPAGDREPKAPLAKEVKPPEKVDKAQSVPSTSRAPEPRKEEHKAVGGDKHDVGQTTSDFRPKDIGVTKEKPEIATPATKAKAIGTDKDAGIHKPVESKIPMPKTVPVTPTKVREPAQISSAPLPSTSKRATLSDTKFKTPDRRAPTKKPPLEHHPPKEKGLGEAQQKPSYPSTSRESPKKPLETKKTKPLGAGAAAVGATEAAAATAPPRRKVPRPSASDDDVAQKKKHREEAKGKGAPQKTDEGISKISPKTKPEEIKDKTKTPSRPSRIATKTPPPKDTKDSPKTLTTLMAPKPIDEQQSKEMTPVGLRKPKVQPKGIKSEPAYTTPSKASKMFATVLPTKGDKTEKKKETPSKIPIAKDRERKPPKTPAGDAEKEREGPLDEVQEEKIKRPRTPKRDIFDTASSDTDGSDDDWYMRHPHFGRKKSPRTASDAEIRKSPTPKEKKIKKDKGEGEKLKKKKGKEDEKDVAKTPKEKKLKKKAKDTASDTESVKPRVKTPKEKKLKKEAPSDTESKPRVKIPKEKKMKKEDKGASDTESVKPDKKRPRSKEKKSRSPGKSPKRKKSPGESEDIKPPKKHTPKKEKVKLPMRDPSLDKARGEISEVEIEKDKTPFFKHRRGDETPSDILSMKSVDYDEIAADDRWYAERPHWKPRTPWESPRKPSIVLDEEEKPPPPPKSDFKSPPGPSHIGDVTPKKARSPTPPKKPRDRTPKRTKAPRSKSPKKKLPSGIPRKKTPKEIPSGSGDVQPEDKRKRSRSRRSKSPTDTDLKEKKPKKSEKPTTHAEGEDRPRPSRERKPKERKPEKAPKEIKDEKRSPKRGIYSDVQLVADRTPKPKKQTPDSDDDYITDSDDDKWYEERPKLFKGIRRKGEGSPDTEPEAKKEIAEKAPRKEKPKREKSPRHPEGEKPRHLKKKTPKEPKEIKKVKRSPKPLRSKSRPHSDVQLDKSKPKTPKDKKPSLTDSDEDDLSDTEDDLHWYNKRPKLYKRTKGKEPKAPKKEHGEKEIAKRAPRHRGKGEGEKSPARERKKSPRKPKEPRTEKETPKKLRSRSRPRRDVHPKEPKEPRKFEEIDDTPKRLRSKSRPRSDVQLDEDRKSKQRTPKEKITDSDDDYMTESDESDQWYEKRPQLWTRPKRRSGSLSTTPRIKKKDREKEIPALKHVRRRLFSPDEKSPGEAGEKIPRSDKSPREGKEEKRPFRTHKRGEERGRKGGRMHPLWGRGKSRSERSPSDTEGEKKGKRKRPHWRRPGTRSYMSPSDTEGKKKEDTDRSDPRLPYGDVPRKKSPSDIDEGHKEKRPRRPVHFLRGYGRSPSEKSPSDKSPSDTEGRGGKRPFWRGDTTESDRSPSYGREKSTESPTDTEAGRKPRQHPFWGWKPKKDDKLPHEAERDKKPRTRSRSVTLPTDKKRDKHPFWNKKSDQKPRARSRGAHSPREKESKWKPDHKRPFWDRDKSPIDKKPRARSRSEKSPYDTDKRPRGKRSLLTRISDKIDKPPKKRIPKEEKPKRSKKRSSVEKPKSVTLFDVEQEKDGKPPRKIRRGPSDTGDSDEYDEMAADDRWYSERPTWSPRALRRTPKRTPSDEEVTKPHRDIKSDFKSPQDRRPPSDKPPSGVKRHKRSPDRDESTESPSGDKRPFWHRHSDKSPSRPKEERKPHTRGRRKESPSETESKERPESRRPFRGRVDESSTDADRGRKPRGRSKSTESPSETEDSKRPFWGRGRDRSDKTPSSVERSRTPRGRSKSAESPSDTEGTGKPEAKRHPWRHPRDKSPGERHKWMKPRGKRSDKTPSDSEGDRSPHARSRSAKSPSGPHHEKRHPFWPRGRSRSEQSPSDTEGGRRDTDRDERITDPKHQHRVRSRSHDPRQHKTVGIREPREEDDDWYHKKKDTSKPRKPQSDSELDSPKDELDDQEELLRRPKIRFPPLRQRSTVTSDSESRERRPKETYMPKEGPEIKERKRRSPRRRSRSRKSGDERRESKKPKEKKHKTPKDKERVKKKRRDDERSWSRPRRTRKDEAQGEKKKRKLKGSWPSFLKDYTSLSSEDSYDSAEEDAALLTPNRAFQKLEHTTTQWKHRMEEDREHRRDAPG